MTGLLATLLLASASFGIVAVASGMVWCWMNRSRLLRRKF